MPEATTCPTRANEISDAGNESLDSGHVILLTGAPTKQKERQPGLTVSLLPQISTITSSSSDVYGTCFHTDSYWRVQLLAALPTRNQCDMLVTYFLENINWVYHAIHVPSFRKEYSQLWDRDTNSVDLSWLSLLFIVISESALFISSDVAQAIGLSPMNVRNLSHIWYTSSRQALHASGFESKPQLVHLQTFLVSQIYWLATKNVETMNSCLGQAVRNAYSLGLHKVNESPNLLQRDIQRRVWWGLLVCDTFQSCCLERPTVIQVHSSKVPLPANCNDEDLTDTSIKARSLNEPTELSYNILCAKLMTVLQKLYVDNCSRLTSYSFVQSIDAEMMELVDSFPWYFRNRKDEKGIPALATGISNLSWAQHLLHCCICVQRIRMYRPFLHPPVGTARRICIESAEDVLSVYALLRNSCSEQLWRSPRFIVQSYQIYSAAVALAAFLLVERTFPSLRIRKDIEMVIADLAQRETAEDVAVDGSKLLQKMLDMCDRRDQFNPRESERLIPAIAAVFGGEQTTRNYLRHEDGYVLNSERPVQNPVDGLVRVEQRKQEEHLPTPVYNHNPTALSWHEDIGRLEPSSREELYPHTHFSTASETAQQTGPAMSSQSNNNQQERTPLHSQWSDDAALLSELFECPPWDVLPQQLLMSPRQIH
ncbi:hypothetical protein VE02_09950 [Pseudogymnoascus sp. 03VT05]|nr:hypothetical protein VE02_09950 [Pseudogymnoascus sp. 03VT05]